MHLFTFQIIFLVATYVASSHAAAHPRHTISKASLANSKAGSNIDAAHREVVVVTNEGEDDSFLYKMSLPTDGSPVYTDLSGFKQIFRATVRNNDHELAPDPTCFFWSRNEQARDPSKPFTSDPFTAAMPFAGWAGAHRLYCYDAAHDRSPSTSLNKFFTILVENWRRETWLVRVRFTSSLMSTFDLYESHTEAQAEAVSSPHDRVRNNVKRAALITFPGDGLIGEKVRKTGVTCAIVYHGLVFPKSEIIKAGRPARFPRSNSLLYFSCDYKKQTPYQIWDLDRRELDWDVQRRQGIYH